MIISSMGDSMEGLSEMGERRSRVASTSSLAQVLILIVMDTKEMKRRMSQLKTEDDGYNRDDGFH